MLLSEILALAHARSTALIRKDVVALKELLHPKFIYLTANGDLLDLDQYLDRFVRSPHVRWSSQVISEPKLAAEEGVVVLSCLVHDIAEFSGHQLDEMFRSTFTWVRTQLGWQCLAGHTSRPTK